MEITDIMRRLNQMREAQVVLRQVATAKQDMLQFREAQLKIEAIDRVEDDEERLAHVKASERVHISLASRQADTPLNTTRSKTTLVIPRPFRARQIWRATGTRRMTDTYEDADPEEAVNLVGVGPMTLRTAVQMHIEASKTPGVRVPIIAREAGKTPATFDVNDLDKLAEMDQFGEMLRPRRPSPGQGISVCDERCAMTDRYADANPEEAVTVEGVGHMTLRRAVHKFDDWRDHHGLGLVLVYREAGKKPPIFDMADLSRLAEFEHFK